MPARAPLSSKAKRPYPTWFFVLLGIAGIGRLIPEFALFFNIGKAAAWKETPCVIVSGTVGSHSDGSTTTHSIDITYRYTFNGVEHTAQRYQFGNGGARTPDALGAVVERYPPGSRAMCYVDPADPSQAVINRGYPGSFWAAILPMILLCAGCCGWTYCRRGNANRIPKARWQPAQPRHDARHFAAVPLEPLTLKPVSTPGARLVVYVVFALLMNGLLALVLPRVISGWRQDHVEWVFTVTAVVLGILSLLSIAAIVVGILVFFGPRIHITITPGAVALGDALVLEWKIRGRLERLTRLRFVLEGSEEAVYEERRSLTRFTNVFFRTTLFDTVERGEFADGRAQVHIPGNVIHSLDTGSNRITWALCAEGVIPGRPDMNENYPLVLLPMRRGTMAAAL